MNKISTFDFVKCFSNCRVFMDPTVKLPPDESSLKMGYSSFLNGEGSEEVQKYVFQSMINASFG